MVRKVEVQASGENEGQIVEEVVAFLEIGNGVYLPKETHLQYDRKGNVLHSQTRFKDYRVNEPIPPEKFDVKFPEWLRVYDLSTGKFHVWGIDGPRLTFDSPKEYAEWFKYRRDPDVPPEPSDGSHLSRRAWAWWAAAAGGVVVLALGIVLLQKRRKQRS